MIPEVRTYVGGARIGHLKLKAADFATVNYTSGSTINTTLGDDTPTGLLAGHLVMPSDDGEVKKATAGAAALGINLFNVNNYEVVGYENNFSKASDKITFLTGVGAHCAVNVWESANKAKRTAAGSGEADLTYAAGDPLYVSSNGLLTKEDESSSGVVVAVVIDASGSFMEIRMEV